MMTCMIIFNINDKPKQTRKNETKQKLQKILIVNGYKENSKLKQR